MAPKPKEDDDYRCTKTIDLEEIIMTQEKHENIRAVVTYKSGREETFSGKLQKDGTPYKTFASKVADLRAFPTVVDVKVTTY